MKIVEGIYRVGTVEPHHITEKIDSYIKDVSIESVGRSVQGFSWEGEKDTIFNWIRLLDKIDEFLTFCTEKHIRTLLDPTLVQKSELPVPDEDVISALDCSIEILNNVAGKEHYNSLSQLCDLLASSNPVIVNRVLVLLRTMYQRNASGYQSVPPDLANRLQSIAAPPCGPVLIEIGRRDVSLSKGRDRFRFRFSIESNPTEHVDERSEEEKQFSASEPRVVKLERRSDLPDNDFEALAKIAALHGPIHGRRQRFRVLRAIRASAVYDFSEDQLELEACNRFLAAAVLVPVSVLGEVYGRVQETFRKFGSEDLLRDLFLELPEFSDNVILHTLYAYTAKFVGSERGSYKVDGLEKILKDGKYSPLGRFLGKRCQKECIESPLGMKLLEETIAMVSSLCSISYLCDEVLEIGFLDHIVPFIEVSDDRYRHVCEQSLSTVEVLFNNSTTGVERLNACNGFEIIQSRLQSEMTKANGKDVLSYDEKFMVQRLIKTLSRVVITSDSGGIEEKKVQLLYTAFKQIFVQYSKFEAGVFDTATTCFRNILHHEPLQYKVMSSAGVDVAYLDALATMKKRDSAVTLSIIPTISSICLSEAGRSLVKSKNAVHFIADTFLDEQALCCLPASHAIGRALEEMIRHHETMVSDVVEMMVAAVDIVRKISSSVECSIVGKGTIMKDFPSYIAVAISRLTEMLNPVCESNISASKGFLEQGGLQIFVDMIQPKLSVDCFCCTQAASNVILFFRTLLLSEENRDYVLEVILSELRVSLGELATLMQANEQLPTKFPFDETLGATNFIRVISRSMILMASFPPPRFNGATNKSIKLMIDSNLCILTDLECVIGKVIRLLTISDEWRMEMDMQLKANSSSLEDLKAYEKNIEAQRDALNLFFRTSCQFLSTFGRVSENARAIWGDNGENAAQTIGLMSSKLILENLLYLQKFKEANEYGGRRQRHIIRLCRLVTALIFDTRKKNVNSYPLNGFLRFGALDLFLKEMTSIAESCLLLCSEGDEEDVFIPTLKEIKEQERQLEITGIGRSPLAKDIQTDQMTKRSLNISTQHSFLAMLGILEIITSKGGHRSLDEKKPQKDPMLYMPPFWLDISNEPIHSQMIVPICNHVLNSLQAVGLSNTKAWSRCPLPLTKFLRSLLNCEKLLSRSSKFFVSDIENLQCDEKEMAIATRHETIIRGLSSGNQKIIDAMESCRVRMKNIKAFKANADDYWIHDNKSISRSDFHLVNKREGSNLKHSAKAILAEDAEMHLLLSVDQESAGLINSTVHLYSLPGPKDLIHSSFSNLVTLVGLLPSSVHDVADLLMEACSDTLESIKKLFVESLKASFDLYRKFSPSEIVNRTDVMLNSTTHLLCASLNISSKFRRQFSSDVKILLQLLDAWRKGYKTVKEEQDVKVPRWVDACLLSIALIGGEKFQPRDGSVISNSSTKNTDPKKDFLSKVKSLIPPLMQDEVSQFVAASHHALECMKISLKHADSCWKPSDSEDEYSNINAYDPCPKSTVCACLELLAITSKSRKAADAIVSNRGHHLILSLNQNVHHPDCDVLESKILRHLVEDDDSLQMSMEAGIRSTLQRKPRSILGFNGPARASRVMSLKQFSTYFISLACRDPVVFCRAVDSTCTFSKEGDRIEVKLVDTENKESGSTMPAPGSDIGSPNADDEAKRSSKSPEMASQTKKSNKRVPHAVSSVIDAILSRLIQVCSPVYAQKLTELSQEKSENESKLKVEMYLISQQGFCINMLSDLLVTFSSCVTAFLRRDADPAPDWLMGKHANKMSLHTPQPKVMKKEKQSSRKLKGKDSSSQPSKAKLGNDSANLCFLIRFVMRNQISYHGNSRIIPTHQILSKDACSLLITLAQRSAEGQRRICQEVQLIIHSFAYPGHVNASEFSSIRSLEKKDRLPISNELEGALILLATMLSIQGRGLPSEAQDKYHKEVIERLLNAGMVGALADAICQMEISETNDERLKILLSAIIRSLEKLTSVRATAKNQEDEGDMAMNFEDLVAQLNERGWHVAGDEDHEHNTDHGDGDHSDDDMLESSFEDSEDGAGSGSEDEFSGSSYESSPYSMHSDESGWEYGSEDLPMNGSDSDEEPMVIGMYPSGAEESPTDDSEMSDGSDDHEDIEDEDIDDADIIRDYEYELNDIFPPEETELDIHHMTPNIFGAPIRGMTGVDSTYEAVLRATGHPPSRYLEYVEGASEEEAFLDGNEEMMDEYYSDEEYEEDVQLPFGDDRLVSSHSLANSAIPGFWIQDSEGERAPAPGWRDQDPLFGTAFTSSRLLAPLIVYHDESSDDPLELPVSEYSHPLITRSSIGALRVSGIQGRQISLSHDFPSGPGYSRGWSPSDPRLSDPLRLGHASYSPSMMISQMSRRLPGRTADRFATAISDSILGGRSAGGPRRRDRFELNLNRPVSTQVNVFENLFRTNSPPLARPRQRQRTNGETGGAFGQDAEQMQDVLGNVSGRPPNETVASQNIEDEDDTEPIDPEFLAALPPDLQREVLENHERERRARRITRAAEAVSRRLDNEARDNVTTRGNISDIVPNIPEDLQADTIMGINMFSPTRTALHAAANDGEVNNEDNGHQELEDIPEGRAQTTNARSNTFEALFSELQQPDESNDILERLSELRQMQTTGSRRRSRGRTWGIDMPIRSDLPRMDRTPNIDPLVDRRRLNERVDSNMDIQSDSKPLLHDDQIPQLLRLLKLSRWEGRLHLNRTVRHLTESRQTASAIYTQVFSLLRCPLSEVESRPDMLEEVLTELKHPVPSMLTKIHAYIVSTHGSSHVVKCLGLEPTEDDQETSSGTLAISVARRVLELLRHCFNLFKRGVDNVLNLQVPCIYDLYYSMGIVSADLSAGQVTSIPALDVLLSLPLRHDVSKSNLRGIALEIVCKFLHHFEKVENDIHEKERRIREKKSQIHKSVTEGAEGVTLATLDLEQLETGRESLVKKAEGYREAFGRVNADIVKNYVMMLTYPSLKESETDSVRIILQSLTTIHMSHWKTLAGAATDFVKTLSEAAKLDLYELSAGDIANQLGKADTKGIGIFRCLQAVAEGVFQLVVDRFNTFPPSLPEDAAMARDIAAQSLSRMLDETKESLWEPFNAATDAIEIWLQKEEMIHGKSMPLAVQLIKPYVESYFLLHDTLRCASCSLETLAREVNELTEEEEAWNNKREEVSKAAQEQATASFTRIQSIDVLSSTQNSDKVECSSPGKSAVCLPSSDSDFIRFAENHRKLVNMIVSHDPAVLDESMNMLLKHSKMLDFENKRVHFRKRVQNLARQLGYHSRLPLNVRRAHVFEDSFNQLRVVSKSQLRSPLKVTFAGEEGVDAGGVSREWYQVMSREMFNPAISLFEAVPQGSSTYQPNPNSVVQTDEARGISHLDYFKFVGHVVGKALLDDQIIDAHFTRSFYKHMLGQPLTYRDIEGVDPDFFKNLSWMLENDIDGVLDLTFSEESDFFGQKSVVELCPNGANIKVTDQNKRDYVDAVARHRMTNAIKPQIHSFLDGFWNVIPRISLSLFNDHELELMISGLPDVDILDLRANCEYRGGYSATSQIILWFWEIAIAMDREQRALLLQFVTGTSKVPVGGFSELQAISGRQKFQIQKAFGDKDRLPTAHTCFNQLDLPEYNTKEQLRERLLMAIHEGKEGFGFA